MTVLTPNHSRGHGQDFDSKGVPGTAARKAWEALFEYRVTGWATCTVRHLTGRHTAGKTCCTTRQPEAIDHAFNLRSEIDGGKAVLIQPYHMTPAKTAELTAWCDQHGLHWHTLGMAFHHPATVAIAIYKETTNG